MRATTAAGAGDSGFTAGRSTSRNVPSEAARVGVGRVAESPLRLAHRLEERRDVAVEDVLLDERLLGERRDPLADGLLVRRQLDLVVDADRDGVGLVAPRDGRGFLRDDLLRVGRVLHFPVVALVLELV